MTGPRPMTGAAPLKVAYVLKRFPRLSETFVLNEILELERRGVEIVIFACMTANDGRFHPQLSRLRAKVVYLKPLEPAHWHAWLSAAWPLLSSHADTFWEVLRESLERGDSARVHEILWGAWVGAQVRRLGVGHIHAHFATMASSVAWFASRISGIPFSFTAHAKDIFAYSPSDHRLTEKAVSASRVVTVTQCNRRYLLEQLPGLDPETVRVIYNGIDLETFTPPAPETREPHLILAVGRLIPKKGFDDLLAACATLKHRGVDFRCVIVGEGPEEMSLRQRSADLALGSDVEFQGALAHHEVLALIRRAAVMCLPCKEDADKNRDALPTVLLEALACGLPVVSTSFSGIPEIVDSGVEGFLTTPGDVPALSAALEALLTAPELRARCGRTGREKAVQRFDLTRNVGELLEVFRASASPATRPTGGAPQPRARVLVLCADRGIPFGGNKGAAVHLRSVAEALHADGHAPTLVVVRRDPDSTYDPPYPVHLLQDRTRNGDRGATTRSLRARDRWCNPSVRDVLLELHRSTGFDVLYERYSLFGVGGRMAAQELGVPFVLEVNAPLVEEAAAYRALDETDVARDVEYYLFSTADHVLCVSEEIQAYVRSVAAAARTSVIPNGVDIDRFDRAVRSECQRRELVPAPADDLIVGFLGRVRPWHGVELLVDALTLLDDCPDVHVCVVGVDADMRAALEQRARDQGVAERCKILARVSPEAAPTLLKSMDILAAPYPQLTRFYFSPLKIFEYMAAARPIVASATGQVREVLADGTSALLVPPGDVRALADAVRRLRDDPALRQRLALAAHAEAARHHTWARRIEQMREIFTTVQGAAAAAAAEMASAATV